ncbi:uncharacterized protein LOC118749487 [Rhagoletis pomonella]|uniref:uncharacterized protein LOC118749487 n=1 Tax=Rhagoletis pomonella TaxID=28610 RepID=UPI00177F248D|nr:uncharacterized protein LOC118749487 [Rhagoletis pomonella]
MNLRSYTVTCHQQIGRSLLPVVYFPYIMYIKKSKVQSTAPWGTPSITGRGLETVSETLVHCHLMLKISLSIVSKARLKSKNTATIQFPSFISDFQCDTTKFSAVSQLWRCRNPDWGSEIR